jgi:hypothetical protein
MNKIDQFPMLKALHAEGPAPDRTRQMMLYGQFVGSWKGRVVSQNFKVDPQGEVKFDDTNETRSEMAAEVHFGWVLQGMAIQDVWIATPFQATQPIMYGTTLRYYPILSPNDRT